MVNSFNFIFQIGNDRQSKRLLANLVKILLFIIIIFYLKKWNTGFSSRYLQSPLTKVLYEQSL